MRGGDGTVGEGAGRSIRPAGIAIGAGASLAAALAVPAAAPAANFTVTNLNDSGLGSLRDVISVANADTGHDTISFQSGLSGTLTLSGSELLVTQPLTISGPDAPLTISGGGSSRVLRFVSAGGSTVSNLTLTGGAPPANAAGGAIHSTGSTQLTIERSTISGNSATVGGGVYTRQGSVTIESSTISGNSATSGGGGAYFYNVTDSVLISNSTVFGNSAGSTGGGIASDLSTVSLRNSIVAGNSAPTAPDQFAFSGAASAAFSLIGSTAGASVVDIPAGSSVFNQDPRLGPLAFNGGPTRTHLPAHDSPAIDKGSTGAATDQRGLTRPRDIPFIADSPASGGDASDIGAVELQPADFDFTLGRLRVNRRRGTARLAVRVPGAGRVVLLGRQVRRTVRQPAGAQVVQLPIRARRKALRRLNRRGRARVRIRVTYAPTAPTLGPPTAKGRAVRLVKRRRR